MYGHGLFLKLNFYHFQWYFTLKLKIYEILMIIFNIEKSSTTFGCKNEIFTKIRFFPFTFFIPNKKPLLTALAECFLKEH